MSSRKGARCCKVLCALSIAGLAACSSDIDRSTPEAVVGAFYKAAFDGDVDRMLLAGEATDSARKHHYETQSRFLVQGVRKCGGMPALMHERMSGGVRSGVMTMKTTFLFRIDSYECQEWTPMTNTLVQSESGSWILR